MSDTDPVIPGQWLRAVVDRYEGRLLRYAARLTGNLDAARDVVQETFLRLCRQPPDEVEPHLAQWLFTVCRNRALDIRRKEHPMATASQNVENCTSREPSQADAVENREEAGHVLRLLESLPANQQEVVRLKFQEGLSYREISQITNLSVTNVGYLIHTAMQKLRKELGVAATPIPS